MEIHQIRSELVHGAGWELEEGTRGPRAPGTKSRGRRAQPQHRVVATKSWLQGLS